MCAHIFVIVRAVYSEAMRILLEKGDISDVYGNQFALIRTMMYVRVHAFHMYMTKDQFRSSIKAIISSKLNLMSQ